MSHFLAGFALGAGLALVLAVCWDARYVRAYIDDEQITVRPAPRYRPARNWMAG